jgi:UDP-3-O-[3-hydroxymyristoyl] glucosamine N-acyltransferase
LKQYTTEQINQAVDGTLDGSPAIMITGVEQISKATANELTFIGKKQYTKLWGQSRASAAIITESLNVKPGKGRALIRVPMPIMHWQTSCDCLRRLHLNVGLKSI